MIGRDQAVDLEAMAAQARGEGEPPLPPARAHARRRAAPLTRAHGGTPQAFALGYVLGFLTAFGWIVAGLREERRQGRRFIA